MPPIAYIISPFTDKFGIPRQSGMTTVECRVVFYEKYRSAEAVRGLDGFDYIWLLWQFDTDGVWHPTVRPPRLGGNMRMGVFATRSPFRPNPIGLSSVKLKRVAFEDCGPVLYVEGADLLDGTQIYDIKPYLPYADSHPDARSGFAVQPEDRRLQVIFPEGVDIPDEDKRGTNSRRTRRSSRRIPASPESASGSGTRTIPCRADRAWASSPAGRPDLPRKAAADRRSARMSGGRASFARS